MRVGSRAHVTRAAIVVPFLFGLAVLPAAAQADAAAAPVESHVFTNADLPTELSVSVIGGSGVPDSAGPTYDMDQIERIAALNERARREYDERRPKGQPEILVVEERSYPWIVSNVGCVGFSRCVSLPRRPRHPEIPHLRNALPDPPEGYVLRSGPHLTSEPKDARPVRRGPRSHVVPRSSRGHVTPRSPR